MSELGRFESYDSMIRASERFVARLQGRPVASVEAIENVAEPRLSCGHEPSSGPGCRQCRTLAAESRRDRRLPEQLDRARRRVEALEGELKRKGIIA